MKNIINEFDSELNHNVLYALYGTIDNKNRNYKTNTNFRHNFNYTINTDFIPNRNKKKKRIKKDKDELIFQNTYDIGNSLSSIKKQLNNVAINERNILKIPKIKAFKSFNNRLNSSLSSKENKINITNKLKSDNNKIITNKIAFSILKSTSEKYDIMKKNEELQNENFLLKENIKFLLSQIKKIKKVESKKNIKEKKEIKNNKNIEKNKISNAYNIIIKYKKEISSLKENLKNLNKENNQLREYIQKSSQKDNHIKNTEIFLKNQSLVKNSNIKNNNIVKNKFPVNQRNNKAKLFLYKRKTFNNTYSTFKEKEYESYESYSYNKNNFEKFIHTLNNAQNNIFDNNSIYRFNYTEKNYNRNNIFNTFSSKKKHIILIDNDFTGTEKIENSNSTINKSNELIYNKKYNIVKTPSSINKDLYSKKQISSNSNKIKKITYGRKLKRKNLFNK